MDFLLDTHTFIWALTDTPKLSLKALDILENESNSIFVSAVSFWEISLKYGLGKLELSGILPSQLPEIAIRHGFGLINLSPVEASSYHQLPPTHHRDPFDRMLIWQAIQLDHSLVSKDPTFKNYSEWGLKVIW